jgi:hypothetical protein
MKYFSKRKPSWLYHSAGFTAVLLLGSILLSHADETKPIPEAKLKSFSELANSVGVEVSYASSKRNHNAYYPERLDDKAGIFYTWQDRCGESHHSISETGREIIILSAGEGNAWNIDPEMASYIFLNPVLSKITLFGDANQRHYNAFARLSKRQKNAIIVAHSIISTALKIHRDDPTADATVRRLLGELKGVCDVMDKVYGNAEEESAKAKVVPTPAQVQRNKEQQQGASAARPY